MDFVRAVDFGTKTNRQNDHISLFLNISAHWSIIVWTIQFVFSQTCHFFVLLFVCSAFFFYYTIIIQFATMVQILVLFTSENDCF